MFAISRYKTPGKDRNHHCVIQHKLIKAITGEKYREKKKQHMLSWESVTHILGLTSECKDIG